jgi:hypothetical protein
MGCNGAVVVSFFREIIVSSRRPLIPTGREPLIAIVRRVTLIDVNISPVFLVPYPRISGC